MTLDELIRDQYPAGCRDKLIAESGVTWNVIYNRARVMGIKRPKKPFAATRDKSGIGSKLEYHAAHIDGRMVPMPMGYFSNLVKHQHAWAGSHE